MSKKTVALLMALVLVLGASIGGTLAWLQTKTATVTNTFVVGDIGTLTLTETNGISVSEGDNDVTNPDKYLIVPGVNITKDPKVAYNAHDDSVDDVEVFVFVKIQSGNAWVVDGANYDYKIDNTSVVNFKVDSAWSPLTGVPGVFYKELAAKTDLAATSVIKDNTITVSNTITKEQLEAITDPSVFDLKFTSYAIQQQGLNATTAWAAVSAN